ncbi:DUF2339 domain-containing protein [Marinomonas gallaica]|uniref:DUF2339 domain-containing protein n=1 Tax=Marinomonas gallaica TaxID=1806667 RepID=UPI003CE56D36
MNKKVALALAGLVLGAVCSQDFFGGLIGGIVGFLLGQAWIFSIQVKGLEREVTRLHSLITQTTSETVTQDSTASDNKSVADDTVPVMTFTSSSDLKPDTFASSVADKTPKTYKESDWNETSASTFDVYDSNSKAPSLFTKASEKVRDFFFQGNPVVRVGMLVLFFGLSFLAKYASGAGLFPIELRLTVIALVAIGLLGLGWKTRTRHNGYGLILQGGGIAALYLTLFAAGKLYTLMPTSLAFGLMFVIVLLGAALAVLQNAQILALMATAGGFLAPILTSDGTGSHVGLFSFYLILNMGVLTIAWFKSWRLLNWVGFIFTFVITSTWSVLSYEPDLYVTTQPFLLAFFALYLTISVLFSMKQPPNLKGLVDGSLVFGLPIVAFGLQTMLLEQTEYGLAISALLLSAVYIALASMLWKRYPETHRLLIESFIAIGAVFVTLAVPLALDASWTSATWCIEAAGLVWIGARQKRLLPRVAGYAMYLLGMISLQFDANFHADLLAIFADNGIGLLILAVSALAIALVLQRQGQSVSLQERYLEWVGIVMGLTWWMMFGLLELLTRLPEHWVFAAIIVFISLSMLGVMVLSGRLRWPHLLRATYSLLPLVTLWISGFALVWWAGLSSMHPLANLGWLALCVFAVVQYRFLWLQRECREEGVKATIESKLTQHWHVLTAWLLLGTAYWELQWWQQEMSWHPILTLGLWFIAFTGPLVALMTVLKRTYWPFQTYLVEYKDRVPIPLIALTGFWFVAASLDAGESGFFYLPLLNPLDLMQLAVVVLLGYLFKHNVLGLAYVDRVYRIGAPAILGFIWLNILVLRTMHHYDSTPYNANDLWQSSTVHMALSILWSLCALVIMNASRRLQNRKLWILGASLLGLVLLKLFTKDLTGTGNLARIISFMVVGGLMLLIGYLSPIPSRNASDTTAETKEEQA